MLLKKALATGVSLEDLSSIHTKKIHTLIINRNIGLRNVELLSAALEELLSGDMSVIPNDVFLSLRNISSIGVADIPSLESKDAKIELQIQLDKELVSIEEIDKEIQSYLMDIQSTVKTNLNILNRIKVDGVVSIDTPAIATEAINSTLVSLISINGVNSLSGAIKAITDVDVKGQLDDITRLYNSIAIADEDLTASELATIANTTVLNVTGGVAVISTPLEKEFVYTTPTETRMLNELMSTTIMLTPITDTINGVMFGIPSLSLADVVDKPFLGAGHIGLTLKKYNDIIPDKVGVNDLNKLVAHTKKALTAIGGDNINKLLKPIDLEMPTYRRNALSELSGLAFACIVDSILLINVSIQVLREAK